MVSSRRAPVSMLLVLSMALIIVGGIYIAGNLPHVPPLAPDVVLLVLSVLLAGAAVAALSRQRPFAWDSFFRVMRWTLLAYVVIGGMLEYIFVVDGVRGDALIVTTLMLLVYAVDIPMLLSYSVARYQTPAESPA
ncbi:MAG TPA: hypothetical protein VFB58_02700 [Chloroflexota bacterium]|nr:hypothetical protein [Chloroflexota bacterium]